MAQKLNKKLARSLKKLWPWLSNWAPAGLGLILVFLGLGSFLLSKNSFTLKKESLILESGQIEIHLDLAQEFLKNHQFVQAEKELDLVQELLKQKVNFDPRLAAHYQSLAEQKDYTDPQLIKKMIAAWQAILTQKPDYRDGWYQLAFLNYLLKQDQKARTALAKSLALDPFFEPSLNLEKLLEE